MALRIQLRLTVGWVVFSTACATLMFLFPGGETIPYHLIWASFGLLYGLYAWTPFATWVTFWTITAVTAVAIVDHAYIGVIGWEECSEIVLMGVLVALLIWHINRQRAAQNRLEQLRSEEKSRAEQRELAARFGSHEIRTRLSIARGFADLIRAKAPTEDVRADAAVVLRELDRTTALATNLLTLVRLEATHSSAPIDVDELVSSVGTRWQNTSGRTVRWETQAGRWNGNAERLEAALDCLVENAVKFTSAGGSVVVSAHRRQDAIRIEVRDSGVGIPEHEIGKVQQLFGTASTAGAGAGSGLGLSIVQGFLQAHDGELELTSTAGVGTAATLHLPLRRVDALAPPQTTFSARSVQTGPRPAVRSAFSD